MLRCLEQCFAHHGATRVWLTTGSTGEVFWRAAGFVPSGEICPDNNMEIFKKELA